MFTENTVLILGAGASCHLGYPTGYELIERIKQTIHNGYCVCEGDETSFIELREYREFKERLEFYDSHNIDLFLKNNLDYADIGKVLIANEILACEHDKFPVCEFNSSNWYSLLFDALSSGLDQPGDLGKNKLSIVTFNYDISLDCYLETRIKANFPDYADEFLKQLEIIHIYGKLDHKDKPYGSFQKDEGGNHSSSFAMAKKIKDQIHVIGEKKQADLYGSYDIKRAIN